MEQEDGGRALGEEGLSDALFLKFSELLFLRTGIALKDYKKYLVVNRLSRMIGPGRDYPDFPAFYSALSSDPDGPLMTEFVNALTTNYSYFFRDPVHFQLLEQYLRDAGRSQEYLRFWSAASSTGEEAYSIAITLLKNAACLGSDCRVLATDISTKVLAKAEEGNYSAVHIAGHVDPEDLRRFFAASEDNSRYRVKDEARELVAFRYLNLLSDYPITRQMDMIFLRNVLIYFGPEEKAFVVRRMEEYLKPGGYLVVGLSESLVGVDHPFTMCRNSIYRKNA
jgi:chemotaxis protein methyltransferase CheR